LTTLSRVIDLKAARRESERFRAALARRGAAEDFDELLAADKVWREVSERAEGLRAQQKALSTRSPSEEEIARLKALKADLAAATDARAAAEERRAELLARVPNLPDPSAAEGLAEEDAELVREWGEKPTFTFEAKDHLELASASGWVDMARGARLSGSRFAYRIGDVALAEMALLKNSRLSVQPVSPAQWMTVCRMEKQLTFLCLIRQIK
jgi:seryl-tRNA synthetase